MKLKPKQRISEVVCIRLDEEDVRQIKLLTLGSGADASTIQRGLIRIGLAAYQKEAQTNKSEAILRISRAGSL